VDDGKFLVGSGGLYAPTIRHHQGKFHVVCTNIIRAEGKNRDATENFIVSTDDIWSGTWSDPVYFNFEGIDPSLLFDDDGKVYLQGSGGIGPGTTINLFEIDVKTGAKLSEEKIIWKGTGDIFPEGPHLYKVKGWYYLLIAEGGTHGGHMVRWHALRTSLAHMNRVQITPSSRRVALKSMSSIPATVNCSRTRRANGGEPALGAV
jgi:beta-xylosidase